MKAIRASLLLWVLGASPARAYDEDVHSFLVKSALAGRGLEVPAEPIDPGAPTEVRRAIDAWARTSTDAALRDQWTRRYPTPESFDAWALKELLLLAPEANVFGVDHLPEPRATLLEVVELGARHPDDDRRNRDRYAYDEKRQKMRGPGGEESAADPALLNMGKLGALSSQAHAHYGLAKVTLSADPEVLKAEPRRFAVASAYPQGPVLTLAAEMAQLHLELALIAALLEKPSPTLAWAFTGHAFHYLQDTANQIHTVQVGIYDFFVDATIAQLLLSLRTGGGYFGELRTMPSIGIDILTNHHVISEKLARKRLNEHLQGRSSPEGERLAKAPALDDPELARALEETLKPWGDRAFAEPFAFALTHAVIEASSHEGAAVYQTTRAIADARYRRAGVLFDDKADDVDAAISATPDREALAKFFELQERGFKRAGTAMRRFVELEHAAFAAAADPAARVSLRDKVIERLVRRQLVLLAEAEKRRADYLLQPPAAVAGPVRAPLVLAGELLALALVAALVWRFARRRRAGSA